MRALLSDARIFFTLTLLCLLILFFDQINFLNLPKSLLQNLTIPIQFGFYKSSNALIHQFDFIFLSRRILQENKAMQKQLADLLIENTNLRSNLNDNQIIVDQQSSINPKTFNLLPARVIGSGRYLTIDRGSDDGITVDLAVVYRDTYIGLVTSVNPKTSQVTLSSDPDSRIAVFTQNNDGRSRGILSGQFGSEMLLDKILHQEVIGEGDLVYSEGTEGKLPRGLIMGKVSRVYDRRNEIFKQAVVKSIFNVNDLDLVFILRV